MAIRRNFNEVFTERKENTMHAKEREPSKKEKVMAEQKIILARLMLQHFPYTETQLSENDYNLIDNFSNWIEEKEYLPDKDFMHIFRLYLFCFPNFLTNKIKEEINEFN